MEEQKNMVKYEAYRQMYIHLNQALKAKFYYQAIFIEYAIFEDRLASILKYAGVPYKNSQGKDIEISTKVRRIRERPEFHSTFIRNRLPAKTLNELLAWIDDRNRLIHCLAKMPYDDEYVKTVALEGERILKTFKAGASAVIRHYKKQAAPEQQ